jgi:hypothetical protein
MPIINNNNKNNNTAAESPAEGGNSGGDIEQGRSSSSWVAAAISGRTAKAIPSTTTRHDRFEYARKGAAAPVPLIRPIADIVMEDIMKGKTKAKITKTYATPSEEALTTPQSAMEQIEDGDDAAPRPLTYAEFDEEDDPKPKLDLGEESTDEDEGPPLPLTFSQQRDSLHDAKKKVARSQISSSAASRIESIRRGDRTDGPMEEHQSPGDEENMLQQRRVVGQQHHSARARRVLSSADRYPSVPILEAYLVEDEEEGPPTLPLMQPHLYLFLLSFQVVMILCMKQLPSSPNFRGGSKSES